MNWFSTKLPLLILTVFLASISVSGDSTALPAPSEVTLYLSPEEISNSFSRGTLTAEGMERCIWIADIIFKAYRNINVNKVNLVAYLDGIEKDQNKVTFSVHIDEDTGDKSIDITYGS